MVAGEVVLALQPVHAEVSRHVGLAARRRFLERLGVVGRHAHPRAAHDRSAEPHDAAPYVQWHGGHHLGLAPGEVAIRRSAAGLSAVGVVRRVRLAGGRRGGGAVEPDERQQ